MLAELASAVHTGAIRATDLVDRAAERIARHDHALNAVTGLDVDEARAAARAIDDLSPVDRKRLPLAGLPVLVKDIEDVRGWRTTYGSRVFADAPPARTDSPVVAALRAAGAVPLGRANTCEFAHEGHCSNILTGPTHNPWDLAWSPGGSSGGSAAALSAGLVPLATASDGGGSARIPASLTGLLGLKPTHGVIRGALRPAWLDLHTDAMMATTAADLAVLLALMTGPWAGTGTECDPTRILVTDRLTGAEPSGRATDHLMEQTRALAATLGATVDVTDTASLFGDRADLPSHWEDDWWCLSSAEQAHALGRDLITRERDRWDPSFRTALEHGLSVDLERYLDARRRALESRLVLDALLTPGTLLACPVMLGPGYRPDGSVPGFEGAGSPPGLTQTVLANLTGHPAICLPAGTLHGLPWGLQVVAGRGEDRALIRVARAWERARPWPLSAPGHEPFTVA